MLWFWCFGYWGLAFRRSGIAFGHWARCRVYGRLHEGLWDRSVYGGLGLAGRVFRVLGLGLQDFRVRGVDDASVFYYRGLKNYHYYFGGPLL